MPREKRKPPEEPIKGLDETIFWSHYDTLAEIKALLGPPRLWEGLAQLSQGDRYWVKESFASAQGYDLTLTGHVHDVAIAMWYHLIQLYEATPLRVTSFKFDFRQRPESVYQREVGWIFDSQFEHSFADIFPVWKISILHEGKFIQGSDACYGSIGLEGGDITINPELAYLFANPPKGLSNHERQRQR